MSKHSTDYTFSPLLLLVPVPFVLATCLPLDLDHSRAAPPKAQHVAAVSAESQPGDAPASAPRATPPTSHQHPAR
jgi:hypothetical protein